MATLRRLPLGRSADLAGRQRVYEAREALEVDDLGWLAGRRRRIFYDEVLLVTHHRQTGWLAAVVLFLLSLAIVVTAVLLAVAGRKWTALMVGAGALPFLAAAVLRLVVKLSIVTTYGRRSQARVQFWLRQERARAVFQRICARARGAQEGTAARP